MQNVKINGKWEILLPEHRAARPEWYTDKGWERERLDSMHDNLSKEDLLFYIGAEEGDMAGLCALWGVKVGLFEPNKKVWSNIKAIWEANKLPPPAFSFPGFASDTNFDQKYLIVDGFPAPADGPIISDHGFKELKEPADEYGMIPQIRLDSVPFVPTAIALDVEGSEWQVLRGAEGLLRAHYPKIWISIHPEFMFRLYGEYQFELRKWIKDLGYTETFLDYQHELHLFYQPLLRQ